jgi:hypothetical protein
LIRGRQIDGPNELRFGPGDNPSTELQLDESNMAVIGEGDWPNWPSYTRLRTPGCYAYQVDGTSFSTVITFQAQNGP